MKSMTAMNATRKQAGFTIIELVVVILLLGILTATALPRFMDVTDEAHAAVVDALEGGLATGNALFRAQWVAEGQPLNSAVTEFNLYASSAGYPIGLNGTVAAGDCKEIYEGVLQAGGRPAAATMAVAGASTPVVATETEIETATGANPNAVVLTALRADTDNVATDSTICDFYYVGQYRTGTLAVPTSVPYIGYNFKTGEITRGTVALNTGT